MKCPYSFRKKLSIFCYDHRGLDYHCIQCYKSWKEVCQFILEIGKCK